MPPRMVTTSLQANGQARRTDQHPPDEQPINSSELPIFHHITERTSYNTGFDASISETITPTTPWKATAVTVHLLMENHLQLLNRLRDGLKKQHFNRVPKQGVLACPRQGVPTYLTDEDFQNFPRLSHKLYHLFQEPQGKPGATEGDTHRDRILLMTATGPQQATVETVNYPPLFTRATVETVNYHPLFTRMLFIAFFGVHSPQTSEDKLMGVLAALELTVFSDKSTPILQQILYSVHPAAPHSVANFCTRSIKASMPRHALIWALYSAIFHSSEDVPNK
ncbi:hypothetical protein T265_03437 [Opisthorchis viverrini]|uniref:Uncharacterized protein n=1 Tax=Opisthorchis viverrini TaxID=6198 RepID=A0A074ZSG1_OPIVI|nr:hypothetical protein T265_03437 [Opisthorchis viverrini]KER30066.1 hypothetical protein T265_03437 [Opisthorchis viverrini]